MASTIVTIICALIAGAAFLVVFLIIQYILFLPIISPFLTCRTNRNWLNWATIEQYWDNYPSCKTENGTKCHHCGSRNIKQYGLEVQSDTRSCTSAISVIPICIGRGRKNRG